MNEKIDKARKMISVWAVDADRLKQLSEVTGYTQVELVHEAIRLVEEKVGDQKGETHVS
jgi:predicted DNA-binding protein